MRQSSKWIIWLLSLVGLLLMGLEVDSCRNTTKNGWEGFLCEDCSERNIRRAQEKPTTTDTEERTPIDFVQGRVDAFTNLGFEGYRKRILEGNKDGQVLEITGNYYKNESTPKGFDNLGFARAAAIRDLFQSDVSKEKIILKAKRIDKNAPNTSFKGHEYRWVAAQASDVEEVNGCTFIRFAFNSTEGKLNEMISQRLDKMANRIRATGEKIIITGHTDNIGTTERNTELGLQRAEDIQVELLNRRVIPTQIKIMSLGSKNPVATNDTERGRAENRRVEVCVVSE